MKWDQIRGGFIYLEKTKTNEARQIPVSKELEAILKDIRQRDGLRYEHIFTYQGKPIEDNLANSFRTAVKRAGLAGLPLSRPSAYVRKPDDLKGREFETRPGVSWA